ncbi:11442_t:CDS:2, partial [Scutellospora calospora]
CKTSRAEKKKLADDIDSEEDRIEIIPINEISSYISDIIDSLEDSILFSTFHIKLDEDILTSVGTDISIMAKLIVDEIEEGDNFKWVAPTALNFSTHFQGVGTVYFICSQSNEIERKYKDSNCKRTDQFSCNSKLNINIDIPATNAKVTLQHELVHEKLIDVTTPLEIRQEILENLNMDPKFYKHNEDHIISACALIEGQKKKEYDLCFQLETSYVTAIGFTTPLFGSLYNVTKVHCDAIYKTAKGQFELYGLVRNVEGAGFPLAYLILDISKAGDGTQERLHTEALQEYPFLIWDGSETQNIPENIPSLTLYNQTLVENTESSKDTEQCQEMKSKIALLDSLVNHLNIELTNNNLQHVEAVVNNLGCVFTIINDIEIAKARQ